MSKKLALTFEQSSAVHCDENKIIIASGAGVGKTQTLIAFTEARSDDLFLYLTYSESMKSEARRKFGKNVHVHSISSLAYKFIGSQFKDKIGSNISIQETMELFELNYVDANAVIKTLTTFFNSDEDVPKKLNNTKLDDIVNIYFSRMIDEDDFDVTVPHEAYTKYFQILAMDLGYDYIIVDEAQDINKVSRKIIDAQKDARKVYVGDPLQAIYGYRGTVSMLDDPTHHLTQSFRFGKNIAEFVTRFVRRYIDSEYIVSSELNNGTFNEARDRYTYISRTNAHLFDKALELANLGDVFHIHKSEQTLDLLLDGYYKMIGNNDSIKSKYIKSFQSWEHLVGVADKIDDIELKYLSRVVSKHKHNILKQVKLIKKHLVSEEYCSVSLVTTHKAKGLEWDNIELANDFTPLINDKTGEIIDPQELHQEELFILYVAMTRGKKNIVLNSDLNQVLLG